MEQIFEGLLGAAYILHMRFNICFTRPLKPGVL